MATYVTPTTMDGPATTAADTMMLIGRILVAYLFVPAGWAKVTGFAGTVGYITSKGLPAPEVLAVLSAAAEIALGLLILIGWQTRWAALGLALYVLILTPIFHNYWAVPQAQQMMQKISFDKNLAIIGGLLFLAAYGAGRLSFDRRGQAAGESRLA